MWDFSEEPKPKKETPAVKAKTGTPIETIADETDDLGGAVKIIEESFVEEGSLKIKKKRKAKIPLDEAKAKEPKEKEPELYITFEDLDIEPPYVDDFKDEFGVYPVLSVRKFCKLPCRYCISAGKKRFKMQTFEVGQELKVTGIEAGKKVDYNILCDYRGDDLVLEPNMIAKFCKIVNPFHSSFKTKSKAAHPGAEVETPRVKREKRDPEAAKEFLDAVERRKKEAKFSI